METTLATPDTEPLAAVPLPEAAALDLEATGPTPRRRIWPLRLVAGTARRIRGGLGWTFGVLSLAVGLSVLAALPILQFLTLGYFLESSARVARTGRLRDGILGVKPAGRIGAAFLGALLGVLPLWLVRSYAISAQFVDPGGPVAAAWRRGLVVAAVLTAAHLLVASLRGARPRHFLWPVGNAIWLVRNLRRGGLYARSRDGFAAFVAGLRLPYLFRLGLVGFLGTLAWLVVPALLIAAGGRYPVLGVLGALILAVVVAFLPFLQVHYAVDGRWRALFDRRDARSRFQRAPWAFAFALFVLLVAAIPLYLLKIEMIPREAAWLPSLVFVAFLAPAHLLVGWAYARSIRRSEPRHWFFRIVARLAIIPTALLYVLVVFAAQYTSWSGTGSLFDQHAFLLPVPFLGM